MRTNTPDYWEHYLVGSYKEFNELDESQKSDVFALFKDFSVDDPKIKMYKFFVASHNRVVCRKIKPYM